MGDMASVETTSPAVDLKALREKRKQWVDPANQRLKVQNRDMKAIKKALADGPRTVPEITGETDLPSSRVMYYIAGMLKYGQVEEADQAGHYMRYRLAAKE
jgi:uncharacterized protein (UPF0218 family)